MMLRKNILFTLISCCFIQLTFGQIISDDSPNNTTVIDKIVAQVGPFPIYLSDIQAQKLQFINNGETVNEETDCVILEEMMYQKLLLNKAKIDSIEITDEQVNAEMENRLRIIENQIGGREKLEKFYGKTYSQIKNEFRDDIKKRMLSQEMERQVVKDIGVSPEEVKEFYKEIPKDSLPYINEQIMIQQIVIYPKISQESINKTIQTLNEWRDEVMEGKRSFATLATIHSEDLGSAKDGGLIHASRGQMVKPFEAAAFSLEPGEVSNVVKTDYGYHILQLVSRKGDDYTVRHILLSPEIGSKELGEAANLIDECYSRLQKHEITWDAAVKEYSEDDDTKQNQGTIVNPYSGELVWDISNINQIDPQIFQVINGLNTGEISSPSLYTDMRSRKEGVRIVRIKNRTSPHQANLKEDYNFIKTAAENQKKQNIISNWANKQIENTYVKIEKDFQKCDFKYNWLHISNTKK